MKNNLIKFRLSGSTSSDIVNIAQNVLHDIANDILAKLELEKEDLTPEILENLEGEIPHPKWGGMIISYWVSDITNSVAEISSIVTTKPAA